MSDKILPTAGQKKIFMIHCIIYAIAVILMWTLYRGKSIGWVYPWPAWITAAWGLAIIGHICALWTSIKDPALDEYHRQTKNG